MHVQFRCKWLCPSGKCERKARVTAGTLFLPEPSRCSLNHNDISLGSELSITSGMSNEGPSSIRSPRELDGKSN